MRTAFSNDGLAACLARSQGTACQAGVMAFLNEFGSAVNIAFWSVALIVPASRFWPFQLIEAGIFVALTAAALGVTIWLLHRRAAWTA